MATEIKRTCARCGCELSAGRKLEICKPCDDHLEALFAPVGKK